MAQLAQHDTTTKLDGDHGLVYITTNLCCRGIGDHYREHWRIGIVVDFMVLDTLQLDRCAEGAFVVNL